jgi:hypothetical protein
MIRKGFFIILITIIFIHGCFSQIQGGKPGPVLFHGVVMDATTQSRLAGSEILINRSRSASSSEDGTFSFYAFKRDTVVFSLLGYKSASLIISDTLSGKDFLTGVYLKTDTMFIGEVIILPRFSTLTGEMMNPRITVNPMVENAIANVSTASYVARTTPGKLGDPSANYNYLRQKSKIEAYEKGGIPSERILGLNSLLLIPATFLLLHGRPETPPPPKPHITSKDMDDLRKTYIESLRKKEK